ncbi:MAG: ribonuclease P protein component [Patescibacteria group bacterium]
MLPKEYRLRKKTDIDALFARGRAVFGTLVTVKYRKTRSSATRFAMVVGTKVSKKAVDRNKIRRRMRACVADHLNNLNNGYDIAIIAKPVALKAKYGAIRESVLSSLSKAGVFATPIKL